MFTFTVSGLIVILFSLESSLQQDVQAKFSCQGRAGGYYADVDSGCQIYHMCDGLGRQFSYSCPNTTLFQQRMLICDHWYMVNCSRSEIDYSANLLIGQNKPFVEDSEQQPYYRTPRPDLLSQPTASEFNIIYRKGKSQNFTDLNLVGATSEERSNGSSVTNKQVYHLPSHWSTEYFQERATPPSITPQRNTRIENQRPESNTNFIRQSSTVSPRQIAENTPKTFFNNQPRNKQRNFENDPQIFSATTAKNILPVPKAINFNSNNLNNVKPNNINSFSKKDIPVNFKSAFKATTPVFPTKEELVTTESPLDDILNPPSFQNGESPPISNVDNTLRFSNVDSFVKKDTVVNFKSLFKATTPVFPTKEELGTTESPIDDILNPPNLNKNGPPIIADRNNVVKSEDVPVNFKSLFQATTPVFPTKEELGTTESPVDDILNPPNLNNNAPPQIPFDIQLPDVKNVDFAPRPFSNQNIELPSNVFLPPNLPVDNVTEENKFAKTDFKNPKNKSKSATRQNSEIKIKDLRKMFSIPDYDFPLDSVSRPSYDVTLDSFQVNPFLANIHQRQHAFD